MAASLFVQRIPKPVYLLALYVRSHPRNVDDTIRILSVIGLIAQH
jgi:hypothetical protein